MMVEGKSAVDELDLRRIVQREKTLIVTAKRVRKDMKRLDEESAARYRVWSGRVETFMGDSFDALMSTIGVDRKSRAVLAERAAVSDGDGSDLLKSGSSANAELLHTLEMLRKFTDVMEETEDERAAGFRETALGEMSSRDSSQNPLTTFLRRAKDMSLKSVQEAFSQLVTFALKIVHEMLVAAVASTKNLLLKGLSGKRALSSRSTCYGKRSW